MTAKCEKYKSDKSQKRKVRKRTNVGGSTEGKVAAEGGSTEELRKDEIGCTEVRNREMFGHLCRTKSIDVLIFKEQKTVEQQTVELTTFRLEPSSGKRNERQYEKAHEIIKDNR